MDKKLKFKLDIQHFADDANGVAEAQSPIEYITEFLTEALLIPGVTCTQHLMVKQKTKKFRIVKGAAAGTSPLFTDSTVTGESTYDDLEVSIDKKWSAKVDGAFIPNFSDKEFDVERWEALKEQLVIQANEDFIELIEDVAPLVTGAVALTKENAIDKLIDAKTAVKKACKKVPTTLLVSADTIAIIEKLTFFVPNANAVGLESEVKGTIKGMRVVEHPVLTEKGIDFVPMRPDWVKLLTINPEKNCAIPGFGDEVLNGMIVRTTKKENNITTSTTVHMPFGMDILKPTELLVYKVA